MKDVKIPNESPILEKSTKTVRGYDYLIVGGTTKAATTSLFTYLADHPAICAATYKETRFFLSSDYPLPSKYRYREDQQGGDVETYNLLFSDTDDRKCRLRMEATPDYLYCEQARERIATSLPKAKLVFSLREPISRVISWYRFARQIGKLPQTLSFEGYVESLFAALNIDKNTAEQHLQTLHQGCYTLYLKPYFDRFGPERIHILFYEELAARPADTMTAVCHFAGIDAGFYSEYGFKVTNRTQQMRHSELHRKYRDFRFRLRQWTHNKPLLHIPLRTLRRKIEPLYLRFNTQADEKIHISEETRHRLIEYYSPDVQALGELIGKPIPWETWKKSN